MSKRAMRRASSHSSPITRDSSLTVLSPGPFTTIQDLGRPGYLRYGIPAGGALDPFALRAANVLCGNDWGAAALEIAVAGPTLAVGAPCVVAITGADLGPRLDGREIANWRACFVRAGSRIDFAGRRSGACAYLAVSGGIAVPPWLGSRSACPLAAPPGLLGRALRAGDLLPIGRPAVPLAAFGGLSLPPALRPACGPRPEVRVVLGPHADRFTAAAIATFLSARYRITTAADRVGYRLEGPALEHAGGPDIVSCGIPAGGVQVPGDGRPIVLLADHQTVGGYPLIATVIQADLPLVAQCLPGDELSFRAVTVEEAQECYRRLIAGLRALEEEKERHPVC